jgi:uncharacterized protein (TIGR02466 family)
MKYELDRMVIHPLWPTNVYALKTEDLNLMPVIQQEKVKEIGRNRSNVGGYQSHQHMDKVVGFKPLIEQITKFFRTIKQIPGYDTIQDIQIPQMWFNINTRGNYNEIHNHGNQYQFSGTYYVKVPNKCGRICFRDPRQGAVSNEFHFRYSQVNFGTNYHATFKFPVEENLLVIFPSFLEHYVEASNTDEERASISFDICVRTNDFKGFVTKDDIF